MKTIVCTIGTRPEAIKMAPVVLALRQARLGTLPGRAHRPASRAGRPRAGRVGNRERRRPGRDGARTAAGPDWRATWSRSSRACSATLRPDMVLAQGDTTSVLATALAAFRLEIPFGHVEAGLRTGRLDAPFPEEANRVVASHLAAIHFAPTARARANLLEEGIDPDRIHVTGNTVIDALLQTARRDWPIGVAT